MVRLNKTQPVSQRQESRVIRIGGKAIDAMQVALFRFRLQTHKTAMLLRM